MSTTPKALVRTDAATSSETLYTVPTSKTCIVTNIVITNTATSAATATISLAGVVFVPNASIPAESFAVIDVKQVLSESEIIAGFASAATVNFHISGVEVA